MNVDAISQETSTKGIGQSMFIMADFLTIAQAIDIRIVLASSGVARNYFRRPCLLTRRLVVMHARTEVVSLYYEYDSS